MIYYSYNKKYISENYVNFLGWTTKRHIVVIESDDRGSIRMPTKYAGEYLFIPLGESNVKIINKIKGRQKKLGRFIGDEIVRLIRLRTITTIR